MLNIFMGYTGYTKDANPHTELLCPGNSNSFSHFNFEYLPEELQIKILDFFDEMSLVAMKNVNKAQYRHANHDELWEALAKRIRFYQPIMPPSTTTYEKNYNAFLTRVTLILERKIPKNCDIKEWLDSVFVSNDQELINKSLNFINRSKVSKGDYFVCMPFNPSTPSLPILPYLNINLNSGEKNISFKLRSLKVGKIEQITEKYIFSNESTHSYGISGYISSNYGHSLSTHFRTGHITNLFDPIELEIRNKFRPIVSMGWKLQKQSEIASRICKGVLVAIVYYYLPPLL